MTLMNLYVAPESPMMPETKMIKVAIIEDHDDIREGIGFLINSTAGYDLVGKFGSMEDALKQLPKNLPDVQLFDIGLPGMSGIEGARLVKDRYPEMALVALTA